MTMEQPPDEGDERSATQRARDAAKVLEELTDLAYERFLDESIFDFRDYLDEKELARYEEAEQTVRDLGKVVIEISGGVAYVTNNPTGVEVEIIDHDNEEGEAYDALTDFLDRADMPQLDSGEER